MKLEPLEIEEVNSVGDNLRAEVDYGGMAAIEIEEPWEGDTEHGFGCTANIRLTKAQARSLGVWLLEFAGQGESR